MSDDDINSYRDAGLHMLAAIADLVASANSGYRKDTPPLVIDEDRDPTSGEESNPALTIEDSEIQSIQQEFVNKTAFGEGTTIWATTPPTPPAPNNDHRVTTMTPDPNNNHRETTMTPDPNNKLDTTRTTPRPRKNKRSSSMTPDPNTKWDTTTTPDLSTKEDATEIPCLTNKRSKVTEAIGTPINSATAEKFRYINKEMVSNLPPGQYCLTITDSTTIDNSVDIRPMDVALVTPAIGGSPLASDPPESSQNTLSFCEEPADPNPNWTVLNDGTICAVLPNRRFDPASTPNYEPFIGNFHYDQPPRPSSEIIKCGDWNSFPPFPEGSAEAKYEAEQTENVFQSYFLRFASCIKSSRDLEKLRSAARTQVRNFMEPDQVRQSLPLDLSKRRSRLLPILPGTYRVETEPISDDENQDNSSPLVAAATAPMIASTSKALVNANNSGALKKFKWNEDENEESVESYHLMERPEDRYQPIPDTQPDSNNGEVLQPQVRSLGQDINDYIQNNILNNDDEGPSEEFSIGNNQNEQQLSHNFEGMEYPVGLICHMKICSMMHYK